PLRLEPAPRFYEAVFKHTCSPKNSLVMLDTGFLSFVPRKTKQPPEIFMTREYNASEDGCSKNGEPKYTPQRPPRTVEEPKIHRLGTALRAIDYGNPSARLPDPIITTRTHNL